jgi:hypothetical protein
MYYKAMAATGVTIEDKTLFKNKAHAIIAKLR